MPVMAGTSIGVQPTRKSCFCAMSRVENVKIQEDHQPRSRQTSRRVLTKRTYSECWRPLLMRIRKSLDVIGIELFVGLGPLRGRSNHEVLPLRRRGDRLLESPFRLNSGKCKPRQGFWQLLTALR